VSVIAPAAYLRDFAGQATRYGAHVAAQRILRDLADLELFPEEQQRSSSYEPQGKKWSCGA
jgi:hypothetical protein